MSHKVSFLSLVMMAAIGLSIIASVPAQAQPTSPCDPEYMDALEARAWMEAQREIAQNQNLIFKPDSVLAMTCFDRFLGRIVSNAGYTQTDRIFSETTRWGLPPGFSATTTDEAVEEVVLVSMQNFLNANFTEEFLDERSGETYTVPSSISPGVYNCDNMGRIWSAARCMNFMDENNTDAFFDFSWYESNDPRQARPAPFVCAVPSSSRAIDGLTAQSGFSGGRTAAFNGDESMFDVTNEPVLDGSPYLEDPVISHLDQILPGTGCGTSARVLTGVTVQRSDVLGNAPYDEFICVKPGCSAEPAASGVGSCVP